MCACAAGATSCVMYKTYELYIDDEGGRFEPLTCRSHEDLMSAVERMMEERNLRTVEVRHFGTHLFTVSA